METVLWRCIPKDNSCSSRTLPAAEVAPGKPNCTYAIGAGFIALLLDYFARCTEPVALFATGMWMHQKNPLCCGFVQVTCACR